MTRSSPRPPLVFLHGLESGPHGRKYQALATAFGEVQAPDTEGVFDPVERLERIVAATRSLERGLVVGSSFGGLMAVLLAHHHPERVGALVLCAPAVYPPRVDAVYRLPPTVILHGVHDDIVSIAVSEELADRTGATLLRLDDDHGLAASLQVLVDAVDELRA